MIISHKYKFIYIHVPKTAGKALRRSLLNQDFITFKEYKLWKTISPTQSTQHMTAEQLRPFVDPEVWDLYYKFGFVRNPFEALVSSYYNKKFRAENDIGTERETHKTRKWHARLKDSTFNSWVSNGLNPNPNMSQKKWFFDSKTGECLVDFIGRYETMEPALHLTLKKFGIELTLESHNVGAGHQKKYREEYSEASRKAVEPFFQWEIKEFGYEF